MGKLQKDGTVYLSMAPSGFFSLKEGKEVVMEVICCSIKHRKLEDLKVEFRAWI